MIDRLQLTNVLTFRELALEARALTLLSGTNSAGKSSLLHSLALVRQSQLAGTLPESLLLNGALVELGTGRDLLHTDPVEIDGEIALRISLEEGDKESTWTAQYDSAADVLPMASSSGEGHLETLFGRDFQYLKADRIVPEVTFPKSHEAVTVERTLGPRGEHAPNFLRLHGSSPITNKATARGDAVSTSLLDQTNAWLDVLSPGTQVA